MYVCMYVCIYVCQTITFESLHLGSLHIFSMEYGSSSYMQVQGHGHRRNGSVFPQCKTSIGNNSDSISVKVELLSLCVA